MRKRTPRTRRGGLYLTLLFIIIGICCLLALTLDVMHVFTIREQLYTIAQRCACMTLETATADAYRQDLSIKLNTGYSDPDLLVSIGEKQLNAAFDENLNLYLRPAADGWVSTAAGSRLCRVTDIHCAVASESSDTSVLTVSASAEVPLYFLGKITPITVSIPISVSAAQTRDEAFGEQYRG